MNHLDAFFTQLRPENETHIFWVASEEALLKSDWLQRAQAHLQQAHKMVVRVDLQYVDSDIELIGALWAGLTARGRADFQRYHQLVGTTYSVTTNNYYNIQIDGNVEAGANVVAGSHNVVGSYNNVRRTGAVGVSAKAIQAAVVQLTHHFYEHLFTHYQQESIVFLIDNWQNATGEVINWLSQYLLAWLAACTNQRVWLLIAYSPPINLTIVQSYGQQLPPLLPLSSAEIEQRWLAAQLPEELLPTVQAFSRGSVNVLSQLIDGYRQRSLGNSAADEIGWAVETLLKAFSAETIIAIRQASVLRQLSQSTLSALLEDDNCAASAWDALSGSPLLSQDGNSTRTLRGDVRHYLQSWWGANRRVADFVALHDRAGNYYQDMIDYQLEAIYHNLHADEARGLPMLQRAFDSACNNFRLGTAQRLVEAGQSASVNLSAEGQRWIQLFSIRLKLLQGQQVARAEADFEQLLHDAEQPLLRAAINRQRGIWLAQEQRWPQAIQTLQDGLAQAEPFAKPNEIVTFHTAIGETYTAFAEHVGGLPHAASRYDNRAVAWFIKIVLWPFFLYQLIIEHLPLRQPRLWYVGVNARGWVAAHALSQALTHFRQAQKLIVGEKSAEIELAIANLEIQLGQYANAQQRLQGILTQSDSNENRYVIALAKLGLGNLAMRRNDHNAARRNLEEAQHEFRVFPDSAAICETNLLLARLYARQNRTDDGVALLTQTLDLSLTPVMRTEIWRELQQLDDTVVLPPTESKVFTARYPQQLLARLRRIGRLSTIFEISLVYPYTLLVVSTLVLMIEGELDLRLSDNAPPLSISDVFILLLFATLSIILLWLYHLFRSVLGYILARAGRRLFSLADERPVQLRIDADQLTLTAPERTQTMRWRAVKRIGTSNLYLWSGSQTPIASQMTLYSADASLEFRADMVGYEALQAATHNYIGLQETPPINSLFNFTLFDRLAQGVFVLLLLFARWLMGNVQAILVLGSSQLPITNQLFFLCLLFVPLLVLVLAARLAIYRYRLNKHFPST